MSKRETQKVMPEYTMSERLVAVETLVPVIMKKLDGLSAEIKGLRSEMRAEFRWGLGTTIAVGLALAGVIFGFHH